MSGPAREPALALDPQNPWLGLFSYTEDTRAYFHGRDEETAELARRVQRKNLTILFGQSGLGKTSLLRAGLVPRLRPEGYCPVYVRVDYAPDSPAPAEQIKAAIRKATTEHGVWTRTDNTVDGESLWEFLHHRGDLLRDTQGKPLVPLLIFDQFEEVFTLAQVDDAGRARAQTFLADLADLVENRPPQALEERLEHDDALIDAFDFSRADYRILIALREDYLAHLESIKGLMPSITQNRMRLARMTGAQALSAVVEPGGTLVSEEVAESIVRFVAGGSELANAEIEPSLLSLVCRELNNARIAQGRKEISADLLAGSRDTILSEFYERALADQPDGVRRVIEDELLTDSGYRESLAEERVVKALTEAGATADALATLVNRRLLRIEDRLDMRRVELTHDVLCGVVLASRNLRHEREARDAAQRQLAEQKAREEAAHRAMLRARTIATVCVVMMLIAIAGAVFGWVNFRRAQVAETQAQDSRANAEKLVGFLIEDFYYELAPTGRLETLGKLAQRTVAYYDSLPPGMVTTQSRINRAMALIREGQAQQSSGQIEQSVKTLDAGRKVLSNLWDEGNHSEAVAYGLALSLQVPYMSRNLASQIHAKDTLQRAADLLRPFVEGKRASTRTSLLYGDVLNYLSHAVPTPEGINLCETALGVLKGIGALDLSNLNATSSYADVADSQARFLRDLGKIEQAWRVEKQAHDLAERLLERRPGDLHAMFVRTQTAQLLSELSVRRHDSKTALAYALKALESAREEIHFNPSSIDSRTNLAYALGQTARVHESRGELAQALDNGRQAFDIVFDNKQPIDNLNAFFNASASLYFLQAELGEQDANKRTLAMIRQRIKRVIVQAPKGSSLRTALNSFPSFLESRGQAMRNDWKPQLDNALHTVKALQGFDEAKNSYDARQSEGVTQGSLLDAGEASIWLHRYAAAERYLRQARAMIEKTPDRFQGDRFHADYDMLLAMALAGQGKTSDARPLATSALAFYRAQATQGPASPDFHRRYATALYADAMAQPDRPAGRRLPTARLAEAARMIDSAPGQGAQMNSLRSMAARIRAAQRDR